MLPVNHSDKNQPGEKQYHILNRTFVVPLLLVASMAAPCLSFAAAGDLDSSFDNDGIRIVSQSGDNRGQAVAIQPKDGKLVIAGDTRTFGSPDVMVLRLNSNGSLDSTFNGGQIRVVSRSGEDRAQAVALQNDGKIVVAGYTNSLGTNDILLMRFNVDGSFDTTFNFSNLGGRTTGGVLVINRAGDDRVKAMAIQNDGKIVVVGTSNLLDASNDVLVVRVNANGSLDPTFNNGGSQIVSRTGSDSVGGIALQPDGKIVVAGYTNVLGSNDVLVLRFNATGGLDTTFNTSSLGGRVGGGAQVLSQSGDDRVNALVLQPDGKIVVAGQTDRFGGSDIQLVRLNANGGLDFTFKPSGALASAPAGSSVIRLSGNDQAQALALQADGKFVVAGTTDRFGLNDFLVMRLNNAGTLDTTFDNDGVRIAGRLGANQANAVALQADGKIVTVGQTDTFDLNDVEVLRFLGQ